MDWFQDSTNFQGRSLVGKRGLRKVAGSDRPYTDQRYQPGKRRK